ncbi:hypothetical protein FACS1894208_00650 [Clostridia bacterium]|nr:hypothetical protein FACS1894208_00650 [Clostridia bacterium]
MRKTLGGKRYNTEQAKLLYTSDDTTLYRTKAGRFFFYRTITGTIDPCDDTQAYTWLKLKAPGSVLDLAQARQSSALISVTMKLPKPAKDLLDTWKAEERTSVSDVVARLVFEAAEAQEAAQESEIPQD